MTTTLDLINAIEGGKTRDCESTFAELVQEKVANAMAARADEVRACMFESEELDELSKVTLGSYVKKAGKEASDQAREGGRRSREGGGWEFDKMHTKKQEKRLAGAAKAVDRLTKESEE